MSAVEGEVNCGDRGDIRMMGMVLSRGELLNGGLRGADKACVINEMLGRPVDGGGGGRAASRDDDERPVDGGGGGRATTSVRSMVAAAEDELNFWLPCMTLKSECRWCFFQHAFASCWHANCHVKILLWPRRQHKK